MRVMQVMESTIGGTRRHLGDLSIGLAGRGVEVHVVASAERVPDFRRDLETMRGAGCLIHELPMVRAVRPWEDWGHLRQLEQLIRELRPDIVHTHSSKAGALGRTASRRAGVGGRVHTPHTFAFLFDAMFSASKRRFYRWIEKRLASQTDRLIAVSESEAETISASGVADPAILRVVPNGIDPAPWVKARAAAARGSAERERLLGPGGGRLAAIVGLLNVAKGQDLAIRALLEPGTEDLHLWIAGDGELRGELEGLARQLGVGERVHLAGWRDDVPAILASCDLLIVPSRWEGMPYIVLEGMAAGLPVLASRVDGSRELVQDGQTGFLFDIESSAELAAAYRRLSQLDDAAWVRLGEAGRARLFEGYTVELMVDRILEIYAELL